MSRRLRISRPPTTGDPGLDAWLNEVEQALNSFPNFSIISTSDGPESAVTEPAGVLAFDVGSSATTWWGKASGDSNVGWVEFNVT